MKEIRPLTSLRAFAAFLVFMFHYAWVLSPVNRGIVSSHEWVPGEILWRQGDVGVSLFFVLSGFLITRIYYDTLPTGKVHLRRYIVKRAARIWPLFLVLAVIQNGTLLARGIVAGQDLLVTMSMTQGFFSKLVYQGLPVAWSLTVEEGFYLSAPIAFALLAWVLGDAGRVPVWSYKTTSWKIIGTLVGLSVATIGIGLLIVTVVQARNWAWQGFMDSNFHMFHSTIFGRFPEFACGMAGAMVHRNINLERAIGGRRATVFSLVALVGIALCMGGKDFLDGRTGVPAQLMTYAFAYGIPGFTVLLILALSVSGGWVHRVLGHPLPVYLGRISYGFYLIQLSVLMDPLVSLTNHLGALRLPVLVVLTNLVCAAFYQVLEVPARRFIVNRWAG